MFTVFSELIRNFLIYIASLLMKVVGSGFKYLYAYQEPNSNHVFVKYSLNGKKLEEPFEDFISSSYAKLLTPQQLSRLINEIAIEKSNKRHFEITQDETTPEVFLVKNSLTGFASPKLLADILATPEILEHATAASLKELVQGAIKLAFIEKADDLSKKNKPQKDNKENVLHLHPNRKKKD